MKLPEFKLERFFAQYEFEVKYLLCSSDCESFSVDELLALEPGADEALKKLWLGYTESAGSPALRQEIARLYAAVEPNGVLVHSGAEEAIFNFMNATLGPEDHAIVQFPGYQPLYQVADAIGCSVTRWEMSEAAGWELDLGWLEQAIRPNTRLLVINCPHNPTGYLMSREKLEQIVALARAHNLLLFSDEVYRLLEQDPQMTLPPACDLYENAVSLSAMSKAYGLAGLRIGWITTQNHSLYRKLAAFKDYTTICNSAPSEFLATLALRHQEVLLERNCEIVRQNLTLLNDFFARHSALFNWQAPKAGSTAFPSLKQAKSSEAFCHDLLRQKSVLLLPSTIYDFGDRNFRVGFGRKNMAEALQKLAEYLVEYQPEKLS